jgi:2',3'-cyclic-nucleotide 2'-phosphodiesterase (5'-nucleotidase family)
MLNLERNNIKVGIFGITLEKLPEKSQTENVSSVTILPPVEATINIWKKLIKD